MRAIVLRGATWADNAPALLILAAMGLALFTLCALRFPRKVT